MDDEMSESMPSHVSVDSESKDEDGSVDGGGGPPKAKRCKQKKDSTKPKAKRGRGKTSECWKHFTMTEVEGEPLPKAKCNYCGNLFVYRDGGQTSSLKRHTGLCQDYKDYLKGQIQGQGTLSFQPGGSSLASVCTEYNHEETRKIIAKMLIVHDYPFRMVEHKWFNILMRHMNGKYKFIGRKTIRKECIKVYESEKELLKKSLRDVEHVSLTCDLWTSNQTLSYMALVAHYIDADWVMQCRVLNFIELDPPHSGVIIAQAVMECLAEWKIEDKVISLTLDNASSNDVAAKNLMSKFVARKVPGFMPHHFHVRCCAHIVNLVVQDGLQPLQPFIHQLRETVKYLKKSTSRLHKFVEVCKTLNMKIGAGLCLDVSTRWSSTYKMFDACTPYRAAFHEYGDNDLNYKWEPSHADWNMYAKVQPILAEFAEITKVLSGSLYPTANIFYPYIVTVKMEVVKASKSSDKFLAAMAQAMLDKFAKYWEEKNNVMALATILDPRWKMRFVAFCFREIYGEVKGSEEVEDIRKELYSIYDTYNDEYQSSKNGADATNGRSSSTQIVATTSTARPSLFRWHLQETTTEASKSELSRYLNEANVDPDDTKFVLLDWWKVNTHRSPVISRMARRFLTIPATSVSSESTFSTGGRVLDDCRSSLLPTMVEKLVCTSSWIRGSWKDNKSPILVVYLI
jgi:hypothetical protein